MQAHVLVNVFQWSLEPKPLFCTEGEEGLCVGRGQRYAFSTLPCPFHN
jgi:hypothetical protein